MPNLQVEEEEDDAAAWLWRCGAGCRSSPAAVVVWSAATAVVFQCRRRRCRCCAVDVNVDVDTILVGWPPVRTNQQPAAARDTGSIVSTTATEAAVVRKNPRRMRMLLRPTRMRSWRSSWRGLRLVLLRRRRRRGGGVWSKDDAASRTVPVEEDPKVMLGRSVGRCVVCFKAWLFPDPRNALSRHPGSGVGRRTTVSSIKRLRASSSPAHRRDRDHDHGRGASGCVRIGKSDWSDRRLGVDRCVLDGLGVGRVREVIPTIHPVLNALFDRL